MTVILLTVSEEERFLCAEKLSLHRLRDAMGEGLEPLLGLLRYEPYPCIDFCYVFFDTPIYLFLNSQIHEVSHASR